MISDELLEYLKLEVKDYADGDGDCNGTLDGELWYLSNQLFVDELEGGDTIENALNEAKRRASDEVFNGLEGCFNSLQELVEAFQKPPEARSN